MKVKTLHCSPINVMGYKSTFQSIHHEIVFDKEAQGFIVDRKVFIPMGKVTEVALEPEAIVKEEIEEVLADVISQLEPIATKQLKKAKKANGGE